MASGKHVGIIGAGAAGMASAWDLSRAGFEVTIFEASDRVGGLAAGFRDEGWEWTLEKFYHHWFTTDHDILQLIDEIGHSDKIIFPRPRTRYWIDGQIYTSEISPSALLLPIPPLSKLRFALAGAYLKLTPFWKSLEQIPAHNWFLRFMGHEPYDRLFRPLLIGKFGKYYKDVNMAWMWARVKKRSLKLGTFEGGFQAFLDALAEAIIQQGTELRLQSPVEQISQHDGKPTLVVNGESHTFDFVISTMSPKLMLRLTEGLAETAYGNKVANLKSIGGLCVVLALNNQLMRDGTYWLNLPATTPDKDQNEFPFLALVEHTNYMPREHYGGDHIIYCGDYVPPDHEYFSLPEDDLVARFLPSLRKVNPDFSEDWVRQAWVWRAPYAQPVPFVNHSENIPAIQTPIPGLLWASMSQVYPWDRGTNYAVEIGRKAARMIMDNHSSRP